jgi:phage shock protein A
MFKWLKRFFKIGEAEANAALDKLERPIVMIEQGIRDLRADLNKGLAGMAEIKALAIKAENQKKEQQQKASEYQQKALLLLQKAQAGNMESLEADRLASEALMKKYQLEQQANTFAASVDQYNEMSRKMDENNKSLRSKIESYEQELDGLRSRLKVAQSTKEVNQKMAGLDSNETLRTLERMKDKILKEEALAQSYLEISREKVSVDEQINKALEGSVTNPIVMDNLSDLKKQLGIIQNKLEE